MKNKLKTLTEDILFILLIILFFSFIVINQIKHDKKYKKQFEQLNINTNDT